MTEIAEDCTWCERPIPADDGFRVSQGTGPRAAFCRLEHVVPWVIAGPAFPAQGRAPELLDAPPRCAQCESELGPDAVVLVRHRDEHRIADCFCDLTELGEWAKAGGRWRS